MKPSRHRLTTPAPNRRRPAAALLAAMILIVLLSGCRGAVSPRALSRSGADAGYPMPSASHAYAGAVLGHMMAVVTGAAGRIENRAQWRTRGMDFPLRFSVIQKELSDPEFDKSRLLVYDAEIVGLSRVLYHFDPRLNQFKGRLPFWSPFPSEELIALRLLLIGKIARGEKIRLEAVVARLPAIRDSGGHLPPGDLAAMGLSEKETVLIAEAVQSEPAISEYMRHPAIAAAMARMGVLDAPTHWQRPPTGLPPPAPARALSTLAVIAILPSFETDFSPVVINGAEHLRAAAAYRQRTAALRAEIISASGAMARNSYRQLHPDRPVPPEGRWEAHWRAFVDRRVAFFAPDTDPMVITPYNAQAVIGRVCPDADLNIILVGKDVVRSMDIRPEQDAFPNTNRFFLDAADVSYGLAGETVTQISRWVVEKTAPVFEPEWAEAGSQLGFDHGDGLHGAIVGAKTAGNAGIGVR